jgi:hypothetical protein
MRNRSIRRKPAPVPPCPLRIPCDDLQSNPGNRDGRLASNRLSYDPVQDLTYAIYMRKHCDCEKFQSGDFDGFTLFKSA